LTTLTWTAERRTAAAISKKLRLARRRIAEESTNVKASEPSQVKPEGKKYALWSNLMKLTVYADANRIGTMLQDACTKITDRL
jgi:hypothetical protein